MTPRDLVKRWEKLSPEARAALVGGSIVGGLLLSQGAGGGPPVASSSGYPPSLPPPPDLAAVVAAFASHRFPLPAPGEKTIVLLIRRNTPAEPAEPVDPFDDWIGLLWNIGGTLRWWCAPGTAEPGWLPMWGKGRLPTNPAGCGRIAAPQYGRSAWGGGYHQWKEDRPALRQIGTLQIERFNTSARRWEGGKTASSSFNIHTAQSSADWRTTVAKGVRDWSHGCPVLPNPENLAILRRLVGWTPEPGGIAINGAAFIIDDRGAILPP